jgi:hypothetical protein
MIPALRLSAANDAPLRPDGAHVLYWMTAARRTTHSYALDHAIARARELGKPLVVLEALRCDYPWASDRLHAFVLAGMRDNAARFARAGIAYHPYVEPSVGAGKGLLAALAADACLVVGDEFPCFFLPRMQAAAAARLPVRFERVDGNGIIPLRAPNPRTFTTANSFRRFTFLRRPSPSSTSTRSPTRSPASTSRRHTSPPTSCAAGRAPTRPCCAATSPRSPACRSTIRSPRAATAAASPPTAC